MNRRLWSMIIAIAFSAEHSLVIAQEPEAPTQQAAQTADLPVAWLGTWSGNVDVYSIKGAATSFQMQLTIAPTNNAGTLQWKIVYDGPQGKSTRDYLLLQKPSDKGQFVIDEQNGILINASLLGNCLSSHFSVQGQQLWSNYRLVSTAAGTELQFELFSADEADSTQSGGKQEVPQVTSLKPATRQFAVLKPVLHPEISERVSNLPPWKKLKTEPYRGKQDDIYFVDEETGWYVNGAGKIFKTSDGGNTWILQLNQTGTYFRCVAFVDKQHGFAGNIGPGYFPNVTDSVALYETKDGGETWTPVLTIEGDPIVGLCSLQILREEFVNAGQLETRVRIIGVGRVGGPTAMIVSDDLGASWQQLDIKEHAAMAFDVHFFNRNDGFIAASTDADVTHSNALILATSDGGKSWTKAWQSNRPYELTWKMSFPTRDVGYVTIQSYNPDPAVVDRFVAKTTDGGKTWSELPLISDARVREFGVAFLDENTGWVGAMPNGFQTVDGGKTWQAVEMGNAVNKIRLLQTETKHVGFAIGVNVFRLDVPKASLLIE